MEAALFIGLIKEVGLPLAEDLLKLFHEGGAVTPESWAALKAKNAIKGEDLIPLRKTP